MTHSTIRRGIGLFGGTFDPIHNGHLTVARHALQAMLLQRLDFVLAPAPWQKHVVTPVSLRIELVRVAIADYERMHLNLAEVMREGPTYTIDTISQLREQVGPSVPLVLIMGADQWSNFHTWKDWKLYPELVSIALCNRENHEPVSCDPAVDALWAPLEVPAREITERPCGALCRFGVPAHRASSTKIREVFAQMPREEAFFTLENWLPVRVARCIAQRGLY